MSSRHILRLSKLTNRNTSSLDPLNSISSPERKKLEKDADREGFSNDVSSDDDQEPVIVVKRNYYNIHSSSSSDSENDSENDGARGDDHVGDEGKIDDENILDGSVEENSGFDSNCNAIDIVEEEDSSLEAERLNKRSTVTWGRKKKSKEKVAATAKEIKDQDGEQLNEDKDIEYLDSIILANQLHDLSSTISTTTRDGTLALTGIPSMTATAYNDFIPIPEIVNNAFFKVEDTKNLDIDNTLRRRFGQQNVGNLDLDNVAQQAAAPPQVRQQGGGMRSNRGVSKSNILSSSRKYLFCNNPKDSWVKPPSYLSGGIGMTKVAVSTLKHNNRSDGSCPSDRPNYDTHSVYYSFEWSEEFTFLNKQYRFIQNSGDVNLLVMFLAHFPYHTEGLHELAMIYAKMGKIDRAFDLVRRGIFVYECSFLTSFKPALTTNCRMDPTIEANRMFTLLLYRYMQMCGMQGCLSVAADVGRYLLSLHPVDDMHYLLLSLDYYLTAAGRHDVMLNYCNLHTDGLLALPLDSTDYHSFRFHSYYVFERWNNPHHHDHDHHKEDSNCQNSIVTDGDGDGAVSVGQGGPTNRSIEDLPNWWFSLALSRYLFELHESNKQRSQSIITTKVSDFLLKAAMFRWPFMLEALMTRSGVDIATLPASVAKPWKDIFNHPFFVNAIDRVPPDSYLLTVCSIYVIRNCALWNREDIQKWVQQCAKQLIDDIAKEYRLKSRSERNNDQTYISTIVDEQRKRYSDLSLDNWQNRHLIKYKQANLEEFREEYARFPNDLDPIDPALNDPHILDGGVRFQNFMDQQGRFLFPIRNLQQLRNGEIDEIVMGRNVMDLNVNAVNHHGEGGGLHIDRAMNNNRDHNQRQESNIDLNLPLMQLFIATLFPWIYVDRRVDRNR